MYLRRFVAFLVVPFALVSACGDDDSTDPDEQFTPEQIQDVFDALGDIVGLFDELDGQRGTMAADVIAAQSTTLGRTQSCPKGGTVAMAGTRVSTSTTLDIDIDFTLSACAVRQVVLAGGFGIDLHAQMSGNTITSTVSATGTLDATHVSGRHRSCAISYSQTTVTNTTNNSEEVTEGGTICGRLISTLSRD